MEPRSAPRSFSTPAKLRAWLAKNHDKKSELWIEYHKVGSGKKGVTYKEALDEALCFGWIDSIEKRIDDASYMQRWTPRKKGSHWSVVNVKKAERLIEEGRMAPAGRAAFEARRKSAAAVELPKLGAPARRALEGAGIRTLADLARWTEADVAALHGVGPTTMAPLKAALRRAGLAFAKPKRG